MRYKSFKFKNFKGIAEIDLDVSKSMPLCLVGLNSQGKTTVLQAIDCFHRHLVDNFEIKNGDRTNYKPRKSDFTGDILLEATFIDDEQKEIKISYSYDIASDCWSEGCEKSISTCDDYYMNIERYRQKIPRLLFYNHDDSYDKSRHVAVDLPSEVYFIRDGIDEQALSVIKNVAEKNVALEWLKESKSPNNILACEILSNVYRSCYPDGEDLQKKVVNDLRDNGMSQKELKGRVKEMEKKLQQKIIDKWDALLKEEAANCLPEVEDGGHQISLSATEKNGIVIFQIEVIKANSEYYELTEQSLGMKWFCGFFMQTEFRSYKDGGAIFLLDEPAANLHCLAQEKVLDLICDLGAREGICLIYATHSPFLIAEELLSNTWIVKNTAVGISCISRYKYEQNDKHVRLFDYTLSYRLPKIFGNFFEKKPTLLTEGWSDVACLRLMLIICEKTIDFNMWRGVDNRQTVANAAFCEYQQIPFLVMKDSDQGGIDAQTFYNKYFSNHHKDRFVSIGDLVEGKTNIESLFEENDIATLVQYVRPDSKGKQSFKTLFPEILVRVMSGDNKPKPEVSEATRNNFANLFQKIGELLTSNPPSNQ